MGDTIATLRARCEQGYAPDSAHTLALLDTIDTLRERIRVLEAIVDQQDRERRVGGFW